MSSLKRGLWRLADPKISLTSAASMYLGVTLAANEGPIAWPWLMVTAVAFFCMEVAKNAWGDIFDFDTGVDPGVADIDRTSFSGGKRVLVDGLLTRAETWGIALGFGAAGVLLGVAIVLLREPSVIWIGIAGLALGWSYHGPPLRLAYRGLGELDVVICYGPLVALSTFMILTGHPSADVIWLSVPLGLYIAAFLWINEFPDYAADSRYGKHNLVARLGKHRASRLLPIIYLLAAGMTLWLSLVVFKLPVLMGMTAVPPAVYASVLVWRDPDAFHRYTSAQPAALIAFLLYSAGAGTGALMS